MSGVEDIDVNKAFYRSAATFEQLDEIIRDYEIAHTVRFTHHRSYKIFNSGHEPWKSFKGTLAAPKLLWVSDLVPATGHPYLSVSRKIYECQYGKQRKSLKPEEQKVDKTPIASYKIGCPCQIEIAEVLRLVSPKVAIATSGAITKHGKRELSLVYRRNFQKLQSGEQSELEFTREFHMTISPLSSHKHVIGEAAAEHQRIDTAILARIHELASSGITAVDVIHDNLNHYVEEELFKGKKLPIKTNRRFYPRTRDIRNHVYLIKNQKQNRPAEPDTSTHIAELSHAEASIIDEVAGVFATQPQPLQQQQSSFTNNPIRGQYGDNHLHQQSMYQLPQQPLSNPHQHYQPSNQYAFPESSFDQFTDPLRQHPQAMHHQQAETNPQQHAYSHVSSYSTVITSTKKPQPAAVSTPAAAGTSSKPPSRWRQRNPKEKFLCLVEKLNKIAHAIDSQKDLNKLSAKLVNVIVEAKPMLSEDKVGVLFEEEPRELLYPRRIRAYKPKRNAHPPKQRYPQINPEATEIPDKKALRAAAKKRASEAKEKRAVEVAAARAKSNQLLVEQERARIRVMFNNNVPILPAAADTSSKVVLVRKPGESLIKPTATSLLRNNAAASGGATSTSTAASTGLLAPTPAAGLSTLANVAASQKIRTLYCNTTPPPGCRPLVALLPKTASTSVGGVTTGPVTATTGRADSPVSFIRCQDPKTGQITISIKGVDENQPETTL